MCTLDQLQQSQPRTITHLSEARNNRCLAGSKDVVNVTASASRLGRGPASNRLFFFFFEKELAVVSDKVGLHKSNSVSSHVASALSTKSVPSLPG